MKRKIICLITMVLCAAGNQLQAQMQLPKIFGNDMVLQRNKPLKIWGWSASGRTVQVHFNHQTATALANNKGEWAVTLKPMPAGGPYELDVVSGKDTVAYKNILLGDVWICGGQSNMEFPVSGWSKIVNAEKEIADANHPTIRLFTVEKSMNYLPAKDLKGGQWQVCTPANIPPFSAVAYFFGRKLNQELNVPIGLISSNWGGTQIQEWISWDSTQTLAQYKDINPNDSASILSARTQSRQAYESAMHDDQGEKQQWFDQQTDTATWSKTIVPNDWSNTKWANANGIIWYRKNIELTAAQLQTTATLHLGVVDDSDLTYINGIKVGGMNSWYTPRSYAIPAGILKAGTNTIVVKVVNPSGGGGFEGHANDVQLQFADNSTIALAGEWLAKPAVLSTDFHIADDGPNSFPSQLYNAMIAPLTPLSMKGVIWYQGEQNSNTLENAKLYRKLFPMLINDWRRKWKDEFPFFWAQLTSYHSSDNDIWPYTREAQHSALSLPETGEAVITDLGEAHDVHPKNKQDVGYRLALAALKVAYHKNLVYAGPVLSAVKTGGNKIVLTFSNTGAGLVAKGDSTLKEFVIAGADKKFVSAHAIIKGNSVIVSGDHIAHPVAVRYAWKDDVLQANLFNRESLPASPFRTDKW